MSKSSSANTKKAPWIPPGKYHRHQKAISKASTGVLKSDHVTEDPMKEIRQKVLEQEHDLDLTYRVESDADKKLGASSVSAEQVHFHEDGMELLSISSDSSLNNRAKLNTKVQFIKQEMAVMAINFSALKTSLKFLYKCPSSLNAEESSIKELWNKTEESMRDFEASYEYLECSLILWQNVIDENEKNIEYINVMKCKENLLRKLLEAYASAIILFQSEIKKQSRQSSETTEDCLRKKLQESERKCTSQDAMITDLERRISIYQGKTNAMESYKSSLEETRAELQKQLSQKEMQIKALNSQLLHHSKNQNKGDHEKLIEIIEVLKSRAQAEKIALKKALKLQRLHVDKKEEKLQSTLAEIREKETMLLEIASQRDQLKVELTIANNNIIHQRNQIEEVKSQSAKYLEKLSEMESTSKLELQSINKTLQEKMAALSVITEEKNSFEKRCEELTEKLQRVSKELRSLKEKNEDVENEMFSRVKNYENLNEAFKEIKHLVMLLQESKQLFQDLKASRSIPNAGGDHISYDLEPDNSRNNILTVVQESKEHLLELKQLYKLFIEEQKQMPKQSETDLQFMELQKKYDSCIKENEALKSELRTIKNAKLVSQNEESFHSSPANVRFSRNKVDADVEKDIQRIKYEYEMRIKDLEYELRETKSKLHFQETQNRKLHSVEEELKSNNQALLALEQRKAEEHDRLQSKIKELQESLDSITADYTSLQLYTQQIKSSCFNVFGFS